jgi:hypothetical protein
MKGKNESPDKRDRVARVLEDPYISKFLTTNDHCEEKVHNATELLFEEHAKASHEEVVETVKRLLVPLRDEKLTVFFSYKSKDKAMAMQIAKYLKEWSATKLIMVHMADFGVHQVGLDWQQKIEETIPRCQWFLLLMPNPEEGRDWILFEAGFFKGTRGLHRRLVCLHHSDNEVAEALGKHQCVPAERDSVTNFLKGLFLEPNWIPGMPPLNAALEDLDAKANIIVNLVQPSAPRIRFCCGPHIQLAFEDGSRIDGWEQLAQGRVEDSNDACRRLFGFGSGPPPMLFRDWVGELGTGVENQNVVSQIVRAIRDANMSRVIPPISATICLPDERRVRPTICAVRMRERTVEAIDILFSEVVQQPDTSLMNPELAALATTLEFAVRFRWEILERFAGREITPKDKMALHGALMTLERAAMRDPRLARDPQHTRELVLQLFNAEDKRVIKEMYDRWDQLRRPDATGELDLAIIDPENSALVNILSELLEMNKGFLTVTSARFAQLISGA